MKEKVKEKLRFWEETSFQLFVFVFGAVGMLAAVLDATANFTDNKTPPSDIKSILVFLVFGLFGLTIAAGFSSVFYFFIKRHEVWHCFRLLRHALYQDQRLPNAQALWTFLKCLPGHPQRFRLYERVRLRIEAELLLNGEVKGARKQISSQVSQVGSQGHSAAIVVANVGELYEQREKLLTYFEMVFEHRPPRISDDDVSESLFTIKVKSGFLAPQYLLAGLLPQFNEDWAPAIQDYGVIMSDPYDPYELLRGKEEVCRQAGKEDDIKTDLRELQAFQFICWLSWGPSIPVCTCARWHGRIGIQFGFGDEDNSIPVFMKENITDKIGVGMVQWLADLDSSPRVSHGTQLPPLAFQSTVTGRLHWDRSGEMLARAQCTFVKPESGHGRLLLEAVENPNKLLFTDVADECRYFSAYVWVLFVICDDDWEMIFKPTVERTDDNWVPSESSRVWRGLLPFFEHANIAEGSNYRLLKSQVAYKALAILNEVCQDHRWSSFNFRYICALDDPGCPNGKAAFNTPTPTILKIMRDLHERFPKLKGRLKLETNDEEYLSSCHLGDIASLYYKSIPKDSD